MEPRRPVVGSCLPYLDRYRSSKIHTGFISGFNINSNFTFFLLWNFVFCFIISYVTTFKFFLILICSILFSLETARMMVHFCLIRYKQLDPFKMHNFIVSNLSPSICSSWRWMWVDERRRMKLRGCGWWWGWE